MDERVRLNLLLDFYGELLNEHRRGVIDDYACNDLSVSEIASERGISRQAVHDMIKRCSAKLEEYEASLGLLDRFLRIRREAESIRDQIQKFKEDRDNSHIENMDRAAERIIENL